MINPAGHLLEALDRDGYALLPEIFSPEEASAMPPAHSPPGVCRLSRAA